jgi:hypothetical protein
MLAADRRVRRGDSRVFMVGLRIYEWTNGRMDEWANLQICKSQWWDKYTTDGDEGKGNCMWQVFVLNWLVGAGYSSI